MNFHPCDEQLIRKQGVLAGRGRVLKPKNRKCTKVKNREISVGKAHHILITKILLP